MHVQEHSQSKLHLTDYNISLSEQFSKAMQIIFTKEMVYNQNFLVL